MRYQAAKQKFRKKRKRSQMISSVVTVFIGLLVLSVCIAFGIAATIYDNKFKNTDPRLGDVEVEYGVTKFCDGTTLVYKSQVRGGESIDAIPNSSECAE